MVAIEDTAVERRRDQARNVVLIALVVAFVSALLGVYFSIGIGAGFGPDAWLIAVLALVSGSLMLLVMLRPLMATSLITGVLSVYFAFHLNAGAIIVYQATGEFVRTIPYLVWCFPLVVFHQFTNFGFYKRPINLLVSLSPLPMTAYVLAAPAKPAGAATLDAVVTFLFSFYVFVICFGYFSRHREEEIERAARAEEANRSAAELRDMEKKLSHAQKMEAVGQLTGGIAHDFNNLLTVILGSAETLADIHASDPEAHALASSAVQAAERGAELTSRLLSFARLQALSPERRDPGALLAGIERLIRRTINEDIEIEIHADIGVPAIEVDPGQFENAVLNLVINARDAMPDGGRMTIEAASATLEENELSNLEGIRAGRYVLIAVSDNGCGMSPDILERAFEPFFTSKAVGKGSGLGLSMVWGFVRQSNGYARIYSEPGEGTTVRLYFPAVTANDGAGQVSTRRAAVGLLAGTERILVAEDDALVRQHVAAQLAELGYDVRAVASAADVLDIMDGGWTANLLFTDVVMPGGMNGKQLADAAMLRQPGLKVLFTSGYTEDAIVHQGRLDPGVNLLGKPYRRADLAAKVRQVLDE